ncbi:MAG: collagen-like protein, partial [Oscillospiraceae bacterium]|nr:collagen-like protein [Oscillospiraceae bacterium]
GDTGAKGDKGDTGEQGVGIRSVRLTADDMLVITLSDNTELAPIGPIRGEKGETGAQGIQGEKGDTGAQGIQGEKGDKGDTGAQGIQGEKGEAGNDGLTPMLSMDAEGNLYVKYGEEGAPALLANLKGPKGDKGDKGDTGAQGIQGEKGDTGAQGIQGEKGDTGAQGEQGPQGVQGIQGETGATGAAGPQGEKGDPGVDGKSAYELYKEAYPAYTGTMEQWLASLKGDKGDPGVGITKTEIIDGSLWITYSDDPENPVNVGRVSETADSGILEYTLLDDGTYGVKAGPGAKMVTNIEIPSMYNDIAVTQILPGGFSGLISLQSIAFAPSITEIGNNAFSQCYELSKVVFPENLTHIGRYAFYACSSLTNLSIPEKVTFIGKYAFVDSGVESATLSNAENWRYLDGTNKQQFRFYYNSSHISNYDMTISSNVVKAMTGDVLLSVTSGSMMYSTPVYRVFQWYRYDWVTV